MGAWREPWDDAPFPALSDSELTAIVNKHDLRVALSQIDRLLSTGVVHTVYAVGDMHVLRVPKPIPEAIEDTYTESVAAPVAHAAGVRTPLLHAFDDDRDIVEVPFTIFERWRGAGLTLIGATASDQPELWRALGGDLATLHLNVVECRDPNGWLDDAGRDVNADELLESAVAEGAINADNAKTLAGWFNQLQPAVVDASYRRLPRRFADRRRRHRRGAHLVGSAVLSGLQPAARPRARAW